VKQLNTGKLAPDYRSAFHDACSAGNRFLVFHFDIRKLQNKNMARNRMLNPEFWLDEELAKLNPHTRLLYMGLWNICDDNFATLPNRPAWIKAQVFPYEEIDTRTLLDELSTSSKIILFRGADGHEYWYIKNFFKYQRVDRPSKPKYPEFKPELEIKKKTLAEHSTNTRAKDKLSKDKEKLNRNKLCDASVAVVEEEKEKNPINQVLEIFAKINPTLNWGNKTSRKAAQEMIDKFTLDGTLRMAEMVISSHGQPYAPMATTPWQMKEKLAQFKAYFDKQKNNNQFAGKKYE